MQLELKNVVKRVGTITHIKPTNLVLKSGCFNVLLGATGSGKTSLIKLMAGLNTCASGEIFFDGENVTKQSTQKRNISLVHQFFINYPHMNVFENIASPLKVAKVAQSEIDDRVEETANLLQLKEMLNRYPHELSGGQQQRIALARAIIKESRAIFLDEPLANLDYKLREELREQLPELFTNRGTVVVYATSEPEDALLLGGYTVLIHDGRISQFGKTSEIYHNPSNITSAEVFSDPPINKVMVKKIDNQIELKNGTKFTIRKENSSLTDGNYIMAIRPNYVSPIPSESSIALLGKVLVTELSGSESSAHFQVGDEKWVSLTRGVQSYKIGESYQFHFNPARCFFFKPSGERVS